MMSTSYLTNAHDFHIQNLTINHQTAVASKAFDLLHDNIAADAVHNSDERCDAPQCHPETRTAVQQDIRGWITHDDDTEGPKILWLSGPAGSGKTAIAGSIAETCDDEGILAGSFFFSSFAGSESRRTKRCLIATLAYCFLQHDALQPLRSVILSAIERDPSIFCKSIIGQCKTLLFKPLQVAARQLALSSLPKVIIVDGLDEVEDLSSRQLEPHEARLANEAEQREILSVLLMAAHNPHFPFRILIVSRPEPVIRDFFSNTACKVTREIFLDSKYKPDSDIDLYLRAKFSDIRRRYRLSPSWPGEDVFKTLQLDSSGQFIYAATVIRFLETAKGHPQTRLDNLLTKDWGGLSVNPNVLSHLDALYMHILNSSPEPELSVRWLGAIANLRGHPALFLRQLLQDYEGQAEYLLENLASLVHLPPLEDDCSPFYFHHKSLLDFLGDRERCGFELNTAFDEGSNAFWRKKFAYVLKARSLTHPLNDSDWQTFLRHFIINDILYPYHDLRRGVCESVALELEEDLVSCDVLWKRMGYLIGKDTPQGLDVYFKPAIPPSCSSAGPVCLSRTEPVTLESYDDEYESMHRLAESMYDLLPANWRDRYREEVGDRKLGHPDYMAYTVLRSEIREVCQKLGVDIEDVDPYRA
ncbi:hypothetical protein NMY22_g10951 [Coprinellus aureogranulatus]|nr:hypothetical protein NMY22_g10951 [Coprinellus aureogranulatus]